MTSRNSMGCGEGTRYLARYGSSRVARVVMIATITPFTLKTESNPGGVEGRVLEDGRAKLSKDRPQQIVDAAQAFFGSLASEAIMQWWTRMIIDRCSMKVMLDLHKVFTETDFSSDLQKIDRPTLLIHGDKDVSTRLAFTSQRTTKLITGSTLKIYEGAAHGLPVTHRERLNADLIEFATL